MKEPVAGKNRERLLGSPGRAAASQPVDFKCSFGRAHERDSDRRALQVVRVPVPLADLMAPTHASLH
jgi:hypothetical protein